MLTLYYLMKKSKSKCKLSARDYYNMIYTNKDKRLKFYKGNLRKCRVCLQEGSTPIFGTVDTVSILEALLILANIEVNEDDEYPKFLCGTCHEFIKGAIVFRKIASESDQVIKQSVKEETVDDHCIDHSYEQDFSDTYVYDGKQDLDLWEKEVISEVKKEKKARYPPKVTCTVCNKVINRSYYKEHMTMHDPDHKKYVCDVCGKSFRLRCAYHNHSLRHGSEFPYKCQLCPYKGRYSELLKTHMRTHSGDYRYMCTECPARFLFKSNLNSHALKHKEPQLQCESCKRAFHTKLMLQRHYEADHLGIKNHVCNICGKAFGYRNAMMKHQRHVHKREKLLFGRMPAYLEAQHKEDGG